MGKINKCKIDRFEEQMMNKGRFSDGTANGSGQHPPGNLSRTLFLVIGICWDGYWIVREIWAGKAV
jgi:hypothetical protein